MLPTKLERLWSEALKSSIPTGEDPLVVYTQKLGRHLANQFPGQPNVQELLLKECGSSSPLKQSDDSST